MEARYTTAVRMSGAVSTEVTVTMGSSSASTSRSSSSATTCRNTWLTRKARGYVAVRRLTASAPQLVQFESSSAPGDLPLLVRLDHVAVLEVLEVRQPDTALEACCDLAHIILETAEGIDGSLPDHRALPQEAHPGATGDPALPHVAA